MAGLLGNLTNSTDNTLTSGDEAKGQGGLLGSVTGAVGKTVDGAGNVVEQTTDGVGNVVGQYASPLLRSKSPDSANLEILQNHRLGCRHCWTDNKGSCRHCWTDNTWCCKYCWGVDGHCRWSSWRCYRTATAGEDTVTAG